MALDPSEPPRGGRPTVSQIAAEAGVSPGTVSKVLNGQGQLRAATRERVLRAADQLGSPRVGSTKPAGAPRTYTVGVLTTDYIGRFTIPILEGAEDVLGAGRMAMILCASRDDPIREQHYLRSLLDRHVDGIIVTSRASDPRPSIGHDFPVPVVYALAQSDDPDDVSVLHDDEEGARKAVAHLIDTGRRRVVHIAGATRHTATQNRLRGARTALEEAGLDFVAGTPMFGEWSESWGREAIQRLLRSDVEFDGVFCGSDQIARGALDALREADRKVPAEFGVVGVDNWDVVVESSRPMLTSVDLNLPEIGRRAAARLLEMIDGSEPQSGVERVPCRLVRRGSTDTF
jgi:LacI family transcriptional regulator